MPYIIGVGGSVAVGKSTTSRILRELLARWPGTPRVELVTTDGIMPLYQRCVHLGCRVPFCASSQWFECPCHGSKYNFAGEYQLGPAPRGMDRFEVTVTDGAYVIDTSQIVTGDPPGTITFDDRVATDMPHCTG